MFERHRNRNVAIIPALHAGSGLFVAPALLAALAVLPATTHPAQALDVFDLFGASEKAPEPRADALPYAVDFALEGGDDALTQALRDASSTWKLRQDAPPGADSLVRRVELDLPRLVDALWGAGYYDADLKGEIAGVAVDLRGAGQAAAITAAEALRNRGVVPVRFVATLGRRYRFGSIRIFDGATLQPMNAVQIPQRVLGVAQGEPATAAAVSASAARIVDHLRNQSHPLARIEKISPVVNHPDGAMDVAIVVDAGPRAGIGDIAISGTKDVDPAVVRSYVYLEKGEPYSPERLADTRRSLSKIEALGSVRMIDGDKVGLDGNLPMTIDVSERKPHIIGLSALYSTVDGPALRTFWADRNLFGGAERLRLDATLGYFTSGGGATFGGGKLFTTDNITGRIAASFVKPAIAGTRNDLLVDAAVARERTAAYQGDVESTTAAVRHRFSNEASVQAGVEVERGRTSDVYGVKDYRLVGAPVSANYDSTDNLLDATRGMRVAASFAPYSKAIGSSLDLVQSKFQGSAYYALDEDARYVIAGRLAVGSMFGASIDHIPANRRFFAGGGGSVRGFAYRSLSPVNAAGVPVGGRSLFEASLEGRVKITDSIGLVPFVDAGGAFTSPYPDFKQKVFVAAGLGLRYYTPIGPIRLDVATPIQKRAGQSPVAVYISVGQAF